MALEQYVALTNVTTNNEAPIVSFNNIPNTYRDLSLVVNGLGTGAGIRGTINNDSASNYSAVYLYGNSAGAGSGNGTSAFLDLAYWPDPFQCSAIINIFDYSATDKHKPLLSRSNTGNTFVVAYSIRWASTAAVNRLDLFLSSGNFPTGTTFSLYGVR